MVGLDVSGHEMSKRNAHPELASFIDSMRAYGMGSGGQASFVSHGESITWKEPTVDVEVILEGKGLGRAWCAAERCRLKAQADAKAAKRR